MKGLERFVGELGNECFGPRRKEWIGAAIGAVGGLASSLFGGAAASKAAREGIEAQRRAIDKQNAYALKEYNQDYVDTAAGQNLVRRAKDYARDTWRRAQGAKAVGGGTDAATQMAKDSGNRMMGDTIANIAATDQSRKQNALGQMMKVEGQRGAMEAAVANNRAQQITNAAQAASNAMMSIGSAVDQSSTSNENLKGGNNNSTVVRETPAQTPVKTSDNAVVTAARVGNNGAEPTDAEYLDFRRKVSQ